MAIYFAPSGAPQAANEPIDSFLADAFIEALPGGGYVTVWNDGIRDGDQDGVFGRVFDASGAPVGTEFQVNTLSASNQASPEIIGLSSGGFLVVYDSFGIDGSLHGIAGQQFTANGVAVGDEFVINTTTSSIQSIPAVTELTNGNIAVTWVSFGGDGNNYGIQGQVISSGGGLIGDEFIANTFTLGGQYWPDVAALSDGGFVVVWDTDGQDRHSFGSYGQRFNAAGEAVGDEFQLHTSDGFSQTRPKVVGLDDGGFVAMWESNHQAGISNYGLYLQRFDASGNRVGGEEQINSHGNSAIRSHEITELDDGGFFVSWSGGSFNSTEYPLGFYGAHFDASANQVGDQILITTDLNSSRGNMPVTQLDNGDLIGVWLTAPETGSSFADMNTQVIGRFGEITGTAAGEALTGAFGNDNIQGLGGNDTLFGLDGTDTLIGGDGNDVLVGGSSENDLRDLAYGGGGHDSLEGGYGNDELRGDAGNDTIAGGFGADTVIGGTGNDTLTGSAFADQIFGGDGGDFVNGGFGHDLLNGGAGGDRFFHIGIADHGSDWIQDYDASEGDILQFGIGSATASQFQVNTTHTATAAGERSGDDSIEEAFVIYRPTGQIMWALVDGAGQSSINLQIGGDVFDLLV
ncbi:hypothetical protein CSC82_16235 [Rhodobacteraceae bacterium 4F10]|nr:hypothetical protein CSC82_16235 [Rhodobacteraceae bacterium 4F10]